MTGCNDLYPPLDVPPCVEMCSASGVFGPLDEDYYPDRGKMTQAFAIGLRPSADAMPCARYTITAGKRLAEGDTQHFKPGVFRVRAGGCQDGVDLGEQIVLQSDRTSELSFTVDLGPHLAQRSTRLCVVKLDADDGCPEKAWWISDSVEVSGVCAVVDDTSPPPSTQPLSDPPQSWPCDERDDCEIGRLHERVAPWEDTFASLQIRESVCRAAERGTYAEYLFSLTQIAGGLLPAGDGRPAIEVAPFLISDREVPRRLYWLLLDPGRSWTQALVPSSQCYQDHPVERREFCPIADITWWGALHFANRMSEAAELPPCYHLEPEPDNEQSEPAARVHPQVGVNVVGGDPRLCEGFRLPTEAEWMYAALSGQPSGDSPSLDAVANGCVGDGPCDMRPGCDLQPDTNGLCDMLGNVWEWVWDVPGAGPLVSAPCESASAHLAKGGGFLSDARSLVFEGGTCLPGTPGRPYFATDVGVRLVRSIQSAPSE